MSIPLTNYFFTITIKPGILLIIWKENSFKHCLISIKTLIFITIGHGRGHSSETLFPLHTWRLCNNFTIPPCLCNTIYPSFICTRLFAHGELPVALCLLMGLFSPYSCHWKKDCLLNRETILHLEADWLQLLFTAIAFIWRGLSTVNNRYDLPIQSSFTRQYRCATKVKFNFNLHYLLFISVPCIKGLSCYWQNAFFPRSLCSDCYLVYYVSSVCLCNNIIFISNFKWKFQLYHRMPTKGKIPQKSLRSEIHLLQPAQPVNFLQWF